LYDEPTTGLDPIAADNIDRLIRRVWESLHVTSIAVTHDMKSARTISNRILMLHDGRIYSEGPTSDILGSSDSVIHRFVNGISTPQKPE
ncbi:MAG: ABC transporter ATP-binding protein, partial [Verrucomicrobiota bacterium]